jgi:hypothetical protein
MEVGKGPNWGCCAKEKKKPEECFRNVGIRLQDLRCHNPEAHNIITHRHKEYKRIQSRNFFCVCFSSTLTMEVAGFPKF